MIIYKKVTECDFYGTQYDTPADGCAVLVRGATGRYCEVMHGGESILAQHIDRGDDIYTVDEARAIVNAEPGSYADF